MSPVSEKTDIEKLRHSSAHVLAQAVQSIYPQVKLAIGPPIKDGFYYDFEIDHAFTDEDLKQIETKCKEIIAQGQEFSEKSVSREEAVRLFQERSEFYKLEIIKGIPEGEEIKLQVNGPFLDLCEGGHVKNTKEIKAFKLLSVAGAYWRGNENNPMLQRIYGTSFFSQKELDDYLNRLEEAKKRDHRKIGRELDLFSFHEESPGMPFFHSKGMLVYNEMIRYWREEHQNKYLEIKTPIVLRDQLWKQSGHYDHYKEHMYFTHIGDEDFAIRPMNCPGGTLVYRSQLRSYRDLPLRMAELGLVHRHELSGVLHGLFRVKAFTIDDAHIFCFGEQIKSEISEVIQLILRMYKTFGFEEVHISLSTRPKESMGSDEIWAEATAGLREALEENRIKYDVHEGGGAFYGPKIDFEVVDSIGREWQCGTIQLDFQMPERFGLEYVGADGKMHRPVMVHRAVFGSIERFFGILIEHFGGALPVWLAPVQVKVMTISEKQEEGGRALYERLLANGIRAEADFRSEKIGYKVREAELQKIPYLAVVGDRELNEGVVSLRARGRQDLGTVKVEDLISKIKKESVERTRN